MRKITIEYRSFGFFNRKQAIEVPERWEDLSETQFSVCAKMHVEPMSDVDFVARFFGLSKRLVKLFSKFEVYKLTELTGFALNPTAVVSSFFIQEIPGTNLLAPQSKLRNISIEHFALFDTYFFDYANQPTPENLCRFVTTLYGKKGERITAIDFDKKYKYVTAKVDKSTQYAIFLNYLFIRKWLSKSFPFVFEQNDDTDDRPAKRKYVNPTKPNRPDWNGIIDGMVGDDIIHYDEYTRMSCLLAFKTINNRIKNYKKNAK